MQRHNWNDLCEFYKCVTEVANSKGTGGYMLYYIFLSVVALEASAKNPKYQQTQWKPLLNSQVE